MNQSEPLWRGTSCCLLPDDAKDGSVADHTITPSAGLELQRDYDLSGRLESVARGGATFGFDVGWLFQRAAL